MRGPWLAAGFGVLATITPRIAAAQSEQPPTRRAKEFVALVEHANAAAFGAYVDSAFGGEFKKFPIDAHQGFAFGLRETSRGLKWVRVASQSATEANVVLEQQLTGDRFTLVVRTEAAAPYRVVGLGSRPATGADAIKLTPSSDADLVADLEGYTKKLADADVFSGAVLIAKDGKVLWSHAYGQANKDFGALNNVDTKFNLGSMNKMFTSIAIAQLVEQGKISLDDPLAKFMPTFPNAEAAKKIKVKHLLTHTSGLGSYFNDEFDKASRARFRTVDQMLELAKGDSLAFEPGARWAYSNTGMLVLGKIIEVVTGQEYYQYIRDRIYKPAGMTNSDAYELDRVNPNLAVGYEKEFQPDGSTAFRNNIFMHVIRGGPAGGGYSTVTDLLRFAEGIKSGTLVTKASYDLFTTPKPELQSPQYGYGFFADGGGIVGHSGGFPGIASNLDIFKNSGYVAVVMSNYGNGGMQAVMRRMRSLVAARAPVP